MKKKKKKKKRFEVTFLTWALPIGCWIIIHQSQFDTWRSEKTNPYDNLNVVVFSLPSTCLPEHPDREICPIPKFLHLPKQILKNHQNLPSNFQEKKRRKKQKNKKTILTSSNKTNHFELFWSSSTGKMFHLLVDFWIKLRNGSWLIL